MLLAFVMSLLVVSVSASEVAVTVDDLPVHAALAPGDARVSIAKKYVKILRKHNVPEVYGFINARKVADDPTTLEVLKVWTEAGYPLGNHTYSHPDIRSKSVTEYVNDIAMNEPMLEKFKREYGPFDFKWFRYPFLREGNTFEKRNSIRDYLKRNGYRIAQVTIDFEDWAWNDPYARCLKKNNTKAVDWLKKSYIEGSVSRLDRARSMSRALFDRDVKHILLLHIGSFDVEVLDELLTRYEAKGVKWIPLSNTWRDPIYQINPDTIKKAGWTFLDQMMEVRAKPFPHFSPLPLKELETACAR